jgi:hypothetical protein
LDFYYNEILQIEKNDARADKVYVIFELAKKAIQERIPGGTLLDGVKTPMEKTHLQNRRRIHCQSGKSS